MTVIRIEPGEVTSTGNQFHSKGNELEGMIQQARGLMNSLQGMFTGLRANAIYREWDAMQPRLTSSVETLHMAGDLLQRAAKDFSDADSRR